MSALPAVEMDVDGVTRRVLVDTGCTDVLVCRASCGRYQPSRTTSLRTANGSAMPCVGETILTVAYQGRRVTLPALVVPTKPLGFDVVWGMTGVRAMGGVQVGVTGEVAMCATVCAVDRPAAMTVTAADFEAHFDGQVWTVKWKWADGVGPSRLRNTTSQYAVPAAARAEYDAELALWIKEGWLVPYNAEVHGAARGLIPLMAVQQPHQGKVRPVLDYRELNGHVLAHTADADVCATQLRRWRRHGTRVAAVDLRKAYLQLRLSEHLWPYQTVEIGGQLYCPTRVGFGLNVAPSVMKAVVQAVLSRDEAVARAVVPYVDDLLVDESIISAERVVDHFTRYGLACKPPVRAADGARFLGLRVDAKPGDGRLVWRRDGPVPDPPAVLTRRAVFAWCGQLVSHVPVAGWLRPAAAWLKRRANTLSAGWDDPITDTVLRSQVDQVAARVKSADPATGPWCVTGESLIVCTDASSLAGGVVLMDATSGGVIEDGSWLRPESQAALHINMAELDAALSGVNLAIAWGATTIELRTDSATVAKWIDDALSGRSRLRTKAHGEMLIRRRIDVIRQLVQEYHLSMSVNLVRSADNPADELTRVPQAWLREVSATDEASETGPSPTVAAVVDPRGEADSGQIRAVHESAGHPGVRRTMWHARRALDKHVRRAAVRDVVLGCDVCQSHDPAPVRWERGHVAVARDWDRLAIDVVHVREAKFLTMIDCGPSRFAIWRRLERATAQNICTALNAVFLEHGEPREILLDNASEFRGGVMTALMTKWNIVLRFRAAYEAGGNGIVERMHRTIKVMVARSGCSVAEAVHRYNHVPRSREDDDSTPASRRFRRPGHDLPVTTGPDDARPLGAPRTGPLRVGEPVWVRVRGRTPCMDRSRPGVVTAQLPAPLVTVDHMPWHVRDVRRRYPGTTVVDTPPTLADGDEDDFTDTEWTRPQPGPARAAADQRASPTPSPVPPPDQSAPAPHVQGDVSPSGTPRQDDTSVRSDAIMNDPGAVGRVPLAPVLPTGPSHTAPPRRSERLRERAELREWLRELEEASSDGSEVILEDQGGV